MANEYSVNKDDLTAVADAIRTKAGTSDPLVFPNGYVSAVEGIQAGGGGGDWIKSFTEGSAVQLQGEDITSVANYKFQKDTSITDVDLPNVGTVGQYAFSEATALESLNLSNTVTLYNYAFNACTALKTAIIPNATSRDKVFYGCTALEYVDISNSSWGAGNGAYGSVFYNCSNLSTVKADKCKIIGASSFFGCKSLTKVCFPWVYSIGYNAFYGCSALSQIDFGENETGTPEIESYAFKNAYSLKAIIIRSQRVCAIRSANAFDKCYHFHGTVNDTYNPDGLKDGYIYVPSALVEEYKARAIWSNFADQFRALEDYTVDGTITGELKELETYSIAVTTSACTIDNSATTIEEGSAYSATITGNQVQGFYFRSDSDFSVTMGGTDITANVVSHDSYPCLTLNINIPSVTGDIVINANAN